MKRSLKTLAACAAFTICMCASMIVSFAAPNLKIDPAALIGYAQDALISEDGASVPGGELFTGIDEGSYTFADLAQSLTEYGLQYEVTDGAHGTVYLIGNAIEIGPAGTFEDPLSADAMYHYFIVGDGYQPIIVTIATKNAEEVISVVEEEISGAAENGLPEIPDEVTDTLNDIYTGFIGAVPDILQNIQDQVPGAVSEVIGAVTDAYSDVMEGADIAIENASIAIDQEFIDAAIEDVTDAAEKVIDDVTGAIGEADPFAGLADLFGLLFS